MFDRIDSIGDTLKERYEHTKRRFVLIKYSFGFCEVLEHRSRKELFTDIREFKRASILLIEKNIYIINKNAL